MIKVKDPNVLLSLSEVPAHPRLQDVMLWLCHKYPDKICITEGFRPGPGVHGTNPCRGRDIRSTVFDQPQEIEDEINDYWLYDPKRPNMQTAFYHRARHENGDWGAWHFHVQVHDNTVRRT